MLNLLPKRRFFYYLNFINMKFTKKIRQIKCDDASKVFSKIYRNFEHKFLFESRDISHIYGRMSLIGIDPALEIRGKGEKFEILSLNERGGDYLKQFAYRDFEISDQCEFEKDMISGTIKKVGVSFEEGERTKQKNIAQIVRLFLEKFAIEEREFMGLYGAFSYDFIRQFEDIPDLLPSNEVYDFRLFLFDSFIFFDHLRDKAEIITYRDDLKNAENAAFELNDLVARGKEYEADYAVKNDEFELSENDYCNLVENARELAEKGELFEVVYSNTLKANIEGDSFGLYQAYREANPSPYLFYFDFGDEQLVGASPEMMVRCEYGKVHLRPISGTAKRGEDPVEDHENMLELLKSEKERAELDMLIDLGRNDLARICESGIEISDYRFVEQYSKVMHTVAHVSGRLRKEFSAYDALIACLNAGTLTGAPKVAAMTEIEKNESSRRGYYGGTIGYLTFSGEMDTGIIIRTAHVKDGELSFRVGATLLYDSDPVSEYQETLNKAQAFLTTISS